MSVIPYGYVYKLTYPDGKIYVGKKHSAVVKLYYFGSGVQCTTLKKHFGSDNINRDILEWCYDSDSLCEAERRWIINLDATNPSVGYNRRVISGKGGEGKIMSDKHKQQNRAALLGIKRSEETKELVSKHHADMSGVNNPMYGSHRSGALNPNYGKRHPGLNSGVNNPNRGRVYTEAQIEACRRRSQGENNPMYGRRGTDNPNYGKLRMNNGIKNTTVRKEDVQDYLERGYSLGWIKYDKKDSKKDS